MWAKTFALPAAELASSGVIADQKGRVVISAQVFPKQEWLAADIFSRVVQLIDD